QPVTAIAEISVAGSCCFTDKVYLRQRELVPLLSATAVTGDTLCVIMKKPETKMKLNLIYLTILIGFLNISIMHSQSDLKLVKKNNENTVHFTMVDKTPFKSDCDGISDEKERTKCLEKSLRDQILNLIEKDYEYSGEMY